MYSKILVPLDGSPGAEAILQHVEALARLCGASLVLLEVLEPLPQHAAVGAPSLYAEGASHRAADIKHYVQEMAEGLAVKGLQAEALVRRGAVVDTILHAAEELQVDLIAMATHGHTGFARFVYCSVAADVMHRTNVPLLMVRVAPPA